MNKLGRRSLRNLQGVDPRLQSIINLAMFRGRVDFTITEGLRTQERQEKLFKEGKSQLDGVNKKSKHQSGMAIDFIPYPFRGWEDIEAFKKVGNELKECAYLLGYHATYGGDWKSFKDYPHLQINEEEL